MVADKFLEIDESARKLIKDSFLYQSKFSEWRTQRGKTIQSIGELREKIETIHFTSNAAKGIGAAIGVAGGLASVFGLALHLTGDKSGSQWMKNGGYASAFGAATAVTASLAEYGFTKTKENEIMEVLDQDMKLLKVIEKWIHHSVVLDSNVRELFGYGIESKLLGDVTAICAECLSIIGTATATWEDIKAAVRKQIRHSENVLELPEKIAESVLNILRKVWNDRKLIGSFNNACLILKNNRALCEIATVGLQIHIQYRSIINSIFLPKILEVFGLGQLSDIGQASYSIVSIALNVVSFIFNTQNILEGSEYAENLKQLERMLKRELENFDREYKRILN